jgi:hypothetical protein
MVEKSVPSFHPLHGNFKKQAETARTKFVKILESNPKFVAAKQTLKHPSKKGILEG